MKIYRKQNHSSEPLGAYHAIYSFSLAVLVMMLGITQARAAECVVLVHGLGRGHHSMSALATRLRNIGYVIVNNDYPSTDQTIEASAAIIDQDINDCRVQKASPIDFVTHSLSGIVLRQYFQDHHIPDAGRVVMLAPPNHGSEIVDHLKNHWWFKRALGPAGQELTTYKNSLPNRLRPIPLQIGIIAGTHSYDPWFAAYFQGPNDGKVSVESTRLAEMKDFVTIDTSHTFIIHSAQVEAFIANGHFNH